jgi:NADP-dependent 3-hydroxy acid dehydrogenase YdfG
MVTTGVVTGAASGIGAALARRMLGKFDRLVLADINLSALHPIADELGAEAVHVDVADPDSVQDLADRAGSPELLCLNAGIISTDFGPPWESSPAEWERMIGVNLGGVVNGFRAFLPEMLADDKPRSVLVTASLAGLLVWPAGGPYAATKHAVVTVAEQAALALEGTNVGVTMLCPALVKTGMSDVGESADTVALDALDAVRARRFAVFPEEWSAAVRLRAESMISGHGPITPTPHPVP